MDADPPAVEWAAGIVTDVPAQNLGGSFDNDSNSNVQATFGNSVGSLSFGNVAQMGLSEDFVANDLTVVGSLAGGGDEPIRGQVLTYNFRVPDLYGNQDGTTSSFVCGAAKP